MPKHRMPDFQDQKPLITIAVAGYNEAPIVEKHLEVLCNYMTSLEDRYEWEIIFINDGSVDNTGALAELFAKTHSKVYVYHHLYNRGLGTSLRDAFEYSHGDYVVTLDLDLSGSPEDIERLIDKMRATSAKVVIASPTAKGGLMTAVPWHRRLLSSWANRFLSYFSSQPITNLTCMYRAYDGPFVRSLHLRSEGMEIMPEIVYKTTMMQEKIDEIPAELNWGAFRAAGPKRQSSMRIFRHTLATLFTGFLLRPFLFFILPSLLLLVFSLYADVWMFIHFFREYGISTGDNFLDRSSHALAVAYDKHPHTFIVGLLSLLLSIQLMALGLLSLQTKHYFEEIFQLGTKIFRRGKSSE
jgi:glycosyltransferase involved in cell wall biosynthesis